MSFHVKNAEGIRGFAVLNVLVLHAFVGFFSATRPYLGATGQFAVWTFFILSAFLLSLKFIAKGVSIESTVEYFVGRFFRIIPIFYLTAIVYYAFGFMDYKKLLAVMSLQDLFLHLWTIPIEFRFYLMIPIICLVCNVITKKYGWPCCVIFILLSVAVHQLIYPYTNLNIKLTLRWYYPVFAYGVAISYIVANSSVKFSNNQALTIVAICIILCVMSTGGIASLLTGRNLPFWNSDKFVFIGLILALFVYVVSNCSGVINTVFDSKFLNFFGKCSFSIYLCHMGIVMRMSEKWPESIYMFCLSLVISTVIGYLMFLLVESPIERFRHRFVSRYKSTQKNSVSE